MKRIILITVLCLLAGVSNATFEVEDPSQPPKDVDQNTHGDPVSGKRPVKEKRIVPVGTNLYAPNIVGGDCNGWRFDESEPAPDDTGAMFHTAKTTYIGVVIKTIDCNNEADGDRKAFALIQIEYDRLIWVEPDKLLSVN